MAEKLDEHLECRLEHERTRVGNVSENEEYKDAGNVMTPSGKVCDDALQRAESSPVCLGGSWSS